MATVKDVTSGLIGVGPGWRLRIRMERTSVDIAGNRSLVRQRVWLQSKGPAGMYWFSNISSSHGASIDGVQVVKTNISRSISSGGSTLILDNARWITHKADGTRSVASAATFSNGYTGNLYFNTSLTLDRIPRATSPSFSGAFTTGSAKTISLPRASSSFTHQVTYSVGGKSGTIASSAGASVSWTPPHSLFNTSPSRTSLSGTIKVTTKSGSSTIGSQSKSFTLNLASNQTPTVSDVTWTENNTHIGTTIGALVQNLSRLSGSVTASGIQGSTISSRQTKIGSTTVNQGTPVLLTTSGTVQGEGIATDSRGRKDSKIGTFTVLPYSEPQVVTVNVERTDELGEPQDTGTYLRLDLEASAQSIVVGEEEKNSLYVVVETRPATSDNWTTRGTYNSGITHNGSIILSGTYALTTSFVVRVTIFDEADPDNKSSVDTVVSSGEVTMDLNGTNLGVGKYWEQGTLDVGGDIYANSINLSEGATIQGATTLESLSVSNTISPQNSDTLVLDGKLEVGEINSPTTGEWKTHPASVLAPNSEWNVTTRTIRQSGRTVYAYIVANPKANIPSHAQGNIANKVICTINDPSLRPNIHSPASQGATGKMHSYMVYTSGNISVTATVWGNGIDAGENLSITAVWSI